ncbi:MAG: polysaccharide deacetylase family protein [Chthoniobacteraceae bacterium]
MVRSALALTFVAFSAACAAPNAPTTAAATPSPTTPPMMALPADANAPTPAGQTKNTYSQCHVDGPFVAMTFDDGPHAENTPRLLDMLKQRGIKATFFVVGQCAAEYPDIMKRIVAEGHEIANHSWSHPQLSKMGEGSVTDQLQRTHDVIVQTTGVTPKIMRPPYGAFTANQRNWAFHKWGYKTILWDVDPLDWKYRNADHVKGAILKDTVNGSIILSHDIHKSTVDAMPGTLDGLAAKGFKFLTVSDLLAMDKPVVPKPKTTPAPKTPNATDEPAPKAVSAVKPPPPIAAEASRK